MKNIIAGLATIIVVGLMAYTFSNGRAFQGGEAANIIRFDKKVQQNDQPVENKNLEKDKIKTLEDKVGSNVSFEVSKAYKSRCASCHGVDGSGLQSGRVLMGPKIIGQSEEKLYKDLVDFKAGRKENIIMKGLLINLTDEDLKSFAKEISQFQAKRDASNK